MAQVGTVTSTGITPLTMKITGAVGETYLVIATVQVNEPTATGAITCELVDNIDQNHIDQKEVFYPVSTADFYSVTLCGSYTIDSTPGGLDLYLNITCASNVTAKEGQLIAIRTDGDDFYTTGINGGSTASSSFSPIVTLGPFTVPSTANYWIVATGGLFKDTTASNCALQLDIDGTGYRVMDTRMQNSTSPAVQPWAVSMQASLAAGSHTITIDARSTTSGTAGVYYSNIFVIYIPTFLGSFYGEETSGKTTTSASYQDELTSTHTATASSYLMIGNSFVSFDTTGGSVATNFLTGATEISESHYTPTVAGAQSMFFGMKKITPGAGLLTQKTQFKRFSGGITRVASIIDSSILWLELSPDAVVNVQGAVIKGATIW